MFEYVKAVVSKRLYAYLKSPPLNLAIVSIASSVYFLLLSNPSGLIIARLSPIIVSSVVKCLTSKRWVRDLIAGFNANIGLAVVAPIK